MTNDEYQAFIEYLTREYLEPRLSRVRERWARHLRFEKWEHRERELRTATKLFRFASRECESVDEIYRTFRTKRLQEAADGLRAGVRFGSNLAEDAGILDCLESHYDEIVEGLTPEHLPAEDYRVLADLGSSTPEEDLQGILYILKRQARCAERPSRLSPNRWEEKPLIRHELERVEKELGRDAESIGDGEVQNESKAPRKQRRWFKGAGQIGQGAALTIANIGLAVGAISFPVSPETQTWGALTSATTGIGMVLTGVGELRGE